MQGDPGIPGVDGEKGEKGDNCTTGPKGAPGDAIKGVYIYMYRCKLWCLFSAYHQVIRENKDQLDHPVTLEIQDLMEQQVHQEQKETRENQGQKEILV